MKHTTTLDALRVGESGTVRAVHAPGTMRRRLLDIGLIPGAPVQCVGVSPLGDPRAYRICGATVALRARDAVGVVTETDRTWD